MLGVDKNKTYSKFFNRLQCQENSIFEESTFFIEKFFYKNNVVLLNILVVNYSLYYIFINKFIYKNIVNKKKILFLNSKTNNLNKFIIFLEKELFFNFFLLYKKESLNSFYLVELCVNQHLYSYLVINKIFFGISKKLKKNDLVLNNEIKLLGNLLHPIYFLIKFLQLLEQKKL